MRQFMQHLVFNTLNKFTDEGNYLQSLHAVFDAVYFDSCRNDAARHQSAKEAT